MSRSLDKPQRQACWNTSQDMTCLMPCGWDLKLPDLTPDPAFTLEEHEYMKGKATPRLPWEVPNPERR